MKSKKKIAIGLLCMALVFMGLGYSLFSTTLNITGSSQSSGTFDVKITNVEVDENNTTSGATNTMDPIGANYAVTETTLSAEFNAPGDYITYDITVTNRGSIDAVISVETNMLGETDEFELSCEVTEGTEVIANNHITFPCRMKFKDNVDNLSNIETANMSVSLKAVQKATYTPPENDSELPDYIISNSGVLLYSTITDSNVTIPDSYNGKTITAIGSYAFYNVGADALIAMDLRDEENPIVKAFPLKELTQEETAMLADYGAEIVSLNEILNFNYEFDEINFSGGIAIAPFSLSETFSTNLTNVDLSNMSHLKEIHYSAFDVRNGAKLQNITFPNNLQVIGNNAFYGNDLTSLNLPNDLVHIGIGAFYDNALTGTLTIPSSVTSIGNHAFAGSPDGSTNQITSLVFENVSHLETIGIDAFSYNALTGTLTIPSSVTSINHSAFAYNLIEELHLESGVSNIGQNAFYMKNSTDLKDVYVDMTESNWNNNVTKGLDIFNGSPTMHYNSTP